MILPDQTNQVLVDTFIKPMHHLQNVSFLADLLQILGFNGFWRKVLKLSTVLLLDKFSGTSIPGKIGSCHTCSPLLNNLSLCGMMDSKLFRNGILSPSRLVAHIIASVKFLLMSFLLGILIMHILNASEKQTTKTFIEVLTLADEQFISYISLATLVWD